MLDSGNISDVDGALGWEMISFNGLSKLVQPPAKFIVPMGEAFIRSFIAKGFRFEEQVQVFSGFITGCESINQEFDEFVFVSPSAKAFDEVGRNCLR